MNSSIRILIEGHDLDSQNDGDWAISVFRNERLLAQSGISGTPSQAIQAARDTLSDADIRTEDDDE